MVPIIVIAILAIIGGCLMGLSTPADFRSPMFIGGYSVIMLMVFIIVVCVSALLSETATFFIAPITLLTIIGASLMSLSTPPSFPAPVFIAGFVFIMIDAVVIFGILVFLLLYVL
jgi:hypothetical protein